MTGRSRCYVIDGGSGAHQIAATRLRVVDSPRHADLLLVIEPVSEKLLPAIADAYRAIPEPKRITAASEADVDRLMKRISSAGLEPFTTRLPSKEEREIATELAVLSLGPLQQLTAGPLRIVLICDGEQVVSAEVEGGFAARNLVEHFRGLTLDDGLKLAPAISPLSPAACLAAFARAVGRVHDEEVATESARGLLLWLVRFADLMGLGWLVEMSRIAAQKLDVSVVDKLRWRVERDRLLRIRFRGVGKLQESFLRERGVTGPVLEASARGEGDVLSRILTRVETAAAELQGAGRESDSSFRTSRGDLVVDVKHDGKRIEEVSWRAPSAPLIDLIPEIVRNERLADAEAIIASLDIATAEVDG